MNMIKPGCNQKSRRSPGTIEPRQTGDAGDPVDDVSESQGTRRNEYEREYEYESEDEYEQEDE